MSKKVWFIRHGESTANAGGRTLNHEIIPLSKIGEEQALQMASEFNLAPNIIIVSRFKRTQQTAFPLLKKYKEDSSFDIWDSVNEFTYLAPASCINTTAAERKARRDEYWERCDPNYLDGWEAESFNMLLNRARRTIDRLKEIERDFIVVFTHGLFMQALEALLINDKEDAKSLMARFRTLSQFNNCDVLKWDENNYDFNKDEINLEKNLPTYLQYDIKQLLNGIDESSSLLDCFFSELESSINCAEVDREITGKQAAYLRKTYL